MEFVVIVLFVAAIVLVNFLVGRAQRTRAGRPAAEKPAQSRTGSSAKSLRTPAGTSLEAAREAVAQLDEKGHQQVYAAIAQGQPIRAIQIYAQNTGCGLRAASAAVASMASHPVPFTRPRPEQPPVPDASGPAPADSTDHPEPDEAPEDQTGAGQETADRDERLQLFMWRDDHKVYNDGASEIKDFGFTTLLSTDVEKRMITGYATRKGYCYDPNQQYSDDILSTNASVIFRASEAYLNYMEACYELNGSLDGTAQSYWKALRKRAGVSEDFQKTIDATDLTKETEDWGLYSGAGKVDETLFNIRRERRNEFMGEDKRFADMLRWRSFDHLMTQEVHVYGFNFWEEQYKAYEEEFGTVVADGSADAVLSSPELGNYILPYRRTDLNNEFVNGLKWHEAYYLNPLGVQDMQLAPQLYQNVNWPTEGGTTALK